MLKWEQSTYTLVIGIAAGAVLVIPFTGKIFDGRRKLLERIRPRGWYTIITFTISVLLGVDKENQAKKEERATKLYDSVLRVKTDSINRRFTDESNAKIINTFAISLAKYGLKYDSSEKVIQKLVRDSSKKVVKIVEGRTPQLSISKISMDSTKGNRFYMSVSLKSSSDAAYHIKIKSYITLEDSNNNMVLLNGSLENLFNNDSQMIPDGSQTTDAMILGPYNLIHIYYLFKGSFKNQEGENFQFRTLLYYKIKLKTFGNIEDSVQKQKVISFYKKNGVS